MSQGEFYYTTTNSSTSWTPDRTGYQEVDCGNGIWRWTPEGYYQFTEYQGPPTPVLTKLNEPLKEGIEMKNLYEVFLVYGEDRKAPIIHNRGMVIADSDEDAKIKSGLYAEVNPKWDADYLTILVRNLGAVKIKEKAKEVKNV